MLADLGESISGMRVNEHGVIEPAIRVPPELIARRCAKSTSEACRIATWLTADMRTRTVSPFSGVKEPEYLKRAAESEDLAINAAALFPGDRNLLKALQAFKARRKPDSAGFDE